MVHFFSGQLAQFYSGVDIGAGRADSLANGFALVAAEIVHDDDVASVERRDEDLFDIDAECLVDENQALRRDPVLILGPLLPPSRDVGTVSFAGRHAFF